MSKKIYVGNISFSTSEETLRNQFSQFGEVLSVAVIMDKFTGKSKGFAFVEMAEDQAADDAISAMNQKEIDGRKVRVNEAQEKKPRTFDRRDDRRERRDYNRDNY